MVKIYTKLALCYDFKGDLQQSLDFSKKVLELVPQDPNSINNVANLCIRLGEYQEAVTLLNTGIVNLLSQKVCDEFMLTMLRSHRVISLTKLNQITEASKDLSEIIKSMEINKTVEAKQGN